MQVYSLLESTVHSVWLFEYLDAFMSQIMEDAIMWGLHHEVCC